jgi:SDR family mycofactocin-dependent oxidoreductase
VSAREGRFAGQVVLVTGAARGQGRSHAVRFAAEGADVIAVDYCSEPESGLPYPAARPADLEETAALVTRAGGRIVTCATDIRDHDGLREAVVAATAQLGPVDVAVANAGILSFGLTWELSEREWRDVVDTNLTGGWNTAKAVIPEMIDQGNGGSIIFTSSVSGMRWTPFLGHYVASKHAVIGLMRNLANELAPHRIRVNVICPSAVDTVMANDAAIGDLLDGHDDWRPSFTNPMPMQRMTTDDVSNAVLWLSSEEARYITGVVLPIDAGLSVS